MIEKLVQSLKRIQNSSRASFALSRAAATGSLRNLDPIYPQSWEFSAFSQNGEDGIIDFLTRQIKKPNHYFIEIGASDGWENNSSWLAIGRKFSGIMIEGEEKISRRSEKMIAEHNLGVDFLNLFVTRENIGELSTRSLYKDVDVFSLDIDGNDYYLAESILEAGFRPKIFVVEYNSAYGPHDAITIEYKADFDFMKAHSSQLYYGVSISGWKKFFQKQGYRFVTVDSNGVNGFFIDPRHFEALFVEKLKPVDFQENFYQLKKFKVSWEKQFSLIKDMKFTEIK